MQATLIRNIVHVQAVHGGRRVWVPAPRLHAHARTGSLRIAATGTRPPLRALRAYRPQVQACKPRSNHNLPLGWDDTCVREELAGC